MPQDAKVAIVAAVVALIPAWISTRSLDATQPGRAVRLYLELFRSSNVSPVQEAASQRDRFPVREAFLATWFLSFFAIFGFGIFIWPGVGR